MDLQSAFEIARRYKPNIDTYSEYGKCFVFSHTSESESEGGSGPIVVPKDGSGPKVFLWAVQNRMLDKAPISTGTI